MDERATLAWPWVWTGCEWWPIFVWWPCDELRTCSGCNLPLTWRQLDIQHLLQHWWPTAKEGTCPTPTGGSVLSCRFTNTVAFWPNKSVLSYIAQPVKVKSVLQNTRILWNSLLLVFFHRNTYHFFSGIGRGTAFTLQGKLGWPDRFLPRIVPTRFSGRMTKKQMQQTATCRTKNNNNWACDLHNFHFIWPFVSNLPWCQMGWLLRRGNR